MLLYDQGSLSWQTFYKAELRSIVFDKESTKKNIADQMEILVQSTKFRTYCHEISTLTANYVHIISVHYVRH